MSKGQRLAISFLASVLVVVVFTPLFYLVDMYFGRPLSWERNLINTCIGGIIGLTYNVIRVFWEKRRSKP